MFLFSLIFFAVGAASAFCSSVWLIVLPACAIAFGLQAFSSLSIAISTSLVAAQLIPTIVKKCAPFLELVVTMSALVFPLVYIPPWLSQLNLNVLALLDPLFLVLEVCQMLSLVRWCNVKAQAGIDNEPTKWKAIVLSFSVISWLSSVLLMLRIVKGADPRLVTALLVLNVLAHAACIYVDSGIISDAALILIMSLVLLKLSPYETEINGIFCHVVNSNHAEPWSDSLLKMLYDLPNLTPASGTFRALTSLASPLFWGSVVSRVGLVAPTLFWLLLPQCVAKGSMDDEGLSSVLKRAAVTGLNLVAYTQAVWRLLNGCRLPYAPSWTRPTQALLLVGSYTAHLAWAEVQSWREDDW
uniref:Putative conserved membrane protein n=1 Tax=Amblyomma triste TaxID=251400 RepID=A0A023G3K0_AMBTT